jgi:YD repeat-containing protein
VLGRIVRVVDPKLNVFSYSYDGLGRRVGVSDPDLGVWAYSLDEQRAGHYNRCKLTAAARSVAERSVGGAAVLLVYAQRQNDYDTVGRLTKETQRTQALQGISQGS